MIRSAGYMQTRALEFGLAMMMVTSGILLAWPGETFSPPYAAVMTRHIGEFQGGLLLAGVGVARWSCLIVNSHLRATPLARILGCCVGSGFWSAFTLALAGVARGGPYGLPLLAALSSSIVMLEIYSGLRCGFDASVLDSLFLRQRSSGVSRSRIGARRGG